MVFLIVRKYEQEDNKNLHRLVLCTLSVTLTYPDVPDYVHDTNLKQTMKIKTNECGCRMHYAKGNDDWKTSQ